jgi:hypothetical protein
MDLRTIESRVEEADIGIEKTREINCTPARGARCIGMSVNL